MGSTDFAAMSGLAFALLGVAGALGLLAVVSPARFATIAHGGGRWIDTSSISELLDRPISVDHYVLRYSRTFGVAVVISAVWLAYLYAIRCR